MRRSAGGGAVLAELEVSGSSPRYAATLKLGRESFAVQVVLSGSSRIASYTYGFDQKDKRKRKTAG